MRKNIREIKGLNFNQLYFMIAICMVIFNFSCSKQEIVKEYKSGAIDSSVMQVNYLAKIKAGLKDSLNTSDFTAVDFTNLYKSRDVRAGNYFLRIGIATKKISDDFILLKTDSAGNIIKGKIVHIQHDGNQKAGVNITVAASSLNRKEIIYLKNDDRKNRKNGNSENTNTVTGGNESSLMKEEPAGEQTLPDVVVVGYIYDDPISYYWYCFDDILGTGGGGGTYTYGSSDPYSGGGGGINTDQTIKVDFEYPESVPAVDIKKYLNCFGSVQETDATYTITIATDIPVDGDPSKFFNWSENSPGHTYLELYKNGNAGLIEQNIGFYPNIGWKTVGGDNIASKIGDNAYHEYNARYTISVTATQFQSALNAIQTYSSYDYNIATFNCTDFALNVFNAAGGNLSIPKYEIPGYPNGTMGSNTPQGLYMKLDQLDAAGYTGIEKPGIKGYGDGSHGPCD